MYNQIYRTTNFTDKKISVKRAMVILAKNDTQADNDEAAVILNFLYLIAKTYDKNDSNQKHRQP